MKIDVDPQAFDRFQHPFADKLIREIKQIIEHVELDEDTSGELIEELAFNICCLIDGSAVLQSRGEPLIPQLCFQDPQDPDRLISGNGGWMHEYVHGLLDAGLSGDYENDEAAEVNEVPQEIADRCFSLKIKFASGVVISEHVLAFEDDAEVAESLAERLFEITAPDEHEDYPIDIRVADIHPLFQEIESVVIDFMINEKVIDATKPGLADKTVEAFYHYITSCLPEAE
ncbi:MAG: hypothetical protein ACFB21_04795 [Opitutales bacterium]